MGIEDINATIDELSPVAAGGVPSTEGFGLPSLAEGGVIDMSRDKDGVFSPTVRRMRRGGKTKRSNQRRNKEMQVLVGERGPELMTVSEDEIRISPVAQAAHGLSIKRPAFGGRRLRPIRQTIGGRSAPVPLSNTGPAPGRRRPQYPIAPDVAGPVPIWYGPGRDPNNPIQPGPAGDGTTPAPAPAPSPAPTPGPDSEPGPNEILQALASVYAHLGFQDSGIPTFREGPRGGMLVPQGTLASDVFERLGVAAPSNVRVLAPTESVTGFTGAINTWLNPVTGRYEQISAFGPGGTNALDDLIQSNITRAQLEAAGFDPTNFISEQIGPGQGPGLPLGDPFSGRDLLAEVATQGAFPLRRNPIAFRPRDAEGNFVDEQGFFLPSPRTLANFYRRSPLEVQAALLSAWEQANLPAAGALGEIDFFTPQGTFSPSQVAGFR